MRFVLFLIAVLLGAPALADGFVQKDLRQINLRLKDYVGGQFEASKEPDRLTVYCDDCDGMNAVDVLIGTSTDGTEARFRSGVTTVQDMRDICQQRDPACKLERSDVGGAVGWVTQYAFGPSAASTAVLLRDGDMLTIRAFSQERAVTGANMATALRQIAPQIVGSR